VASKLVPALPSNGGESKARVSGLGDSRLFILKKSQYIWNQTIGSNTSLRHKWCQGFNTTLTRRTTRIFAIRDQRSLFACVDRIFTKFSHRGRLQDGLQEPFHLPKNSSNMGKPKSKKDEDITLSK